MSSKIQSSWEETMMISSTNMTTLYQLIRKNMTTSLMNLDVNFLQNLSLTSTGNKLYDFVYFII